MKLLWVRPCATALAMKPALTKPCCVNDFCSSCSITNCSLPETARGSLRSWANEWTLWSTGYGRHNKVLLAEELEQQEFISSKFWRPEVPDQDVCRVAFFRGPSPWLVDGSLPPVSSHGLPSVHVRAQILSSFKNTSHIALGLLWWPYFNYLFKDPVSQKQSQSEVLRVRTSTYEFGGDTTQSVRDTGPRML